LARLSISILAGRYPNDANNVLADEHEGAASEEDVPASELLDDIERDRCGTNIDQCCDQLNEKGVGYGAK
jgi:hypothetical protein